jgi:hypothetical protein
VAALPVTSLAKLARVGLYVAEGTPRADCDQAVRLPIAWDDEPIDDDTNINADLQEQVVLAVQELQEQRAAGSGSFEQQADCPVPPCCPVVELFGLSPRHLVAVNTSTKTRTCSIGSCASASYNYNTPIK